MSHGSLGFLKKKKKNLERTSLRELESMEGGGLNVADACRIADLLNGFSAFLVFQARVTVFLHA